MENIQKLDIAPGPWGLVEKKKGIYEVNLGEVDVVDTTGEGIVLRFSNGEVVKLPNTIKIVKAVTIKTLNQ